MKKEIKWALGKWAREEQGDGLIADSNTRGKRRGSHEPQVERVGNGSTMTGFREEETGIKKDSQLSENGIKWLQVQFSLSITLGSPSIH